MLSLRLLPYVPCDMYLYCVANSMLNMLTYCWGQAHAYAVPHFFFLQVEVWLNRLLDSMMSSIRHEMTEAVVSYEEKPRDQWLFDPPAQASYIWYQCVNCLLAVGVLL